MMEVSPTGSRRSGERERAPGPGLPTARWRGVECLREGALGQRLRRPASMVLRAERAFYPSRLARCLLNSGPARELRVLRSP